MPPDLYCARGEMENRIKECQLDLYADRKPPFAVAMSKTPLADGRKLVGYFRLSKTAN